MFGPRIVVCNAVPMHRGRREYLKGWSAREMFSSNGKSGRKGSPAIGAQQAH